MDNGHSEEEANYHDERIQLFVWSKDNMHVRNEFFLRDIRKTTDLLDWFGEPRPERLPELDMSPDRIPLVCAFDFIRKLIAQGIYSQLDIDVQIFETEPFKEFANVILDNASQLGLTIETLRIKIFFVHPPLPYFTDVIEHTNFSWCRWNYDAGRGVFDPGVQITDEMLGKNALCVERKVLNGSVLKEFRGRRLTLWECQDYGITVDFIMDVVERWFTSEDDSQLHSLSLFGFPITDQELNKLVRGREMETWVPQSHYREVYKRCFLTNPRGIRSSIIFSKGRKQSLFYMHTNFFWRRWNSDVGRVIDPGVQITNEMLGKNALCVERKVLNGAVLKEFRGRRLTLWECQHYGITVDFIIDVVEQFFKVDDNPQLRSLSLLGFPITDEDLSKLVRGHEMDNWEQKSHITAVYRRCFLTNSRGIRSWIVYSKKRVQSLFYVVEPTEKDWNEILEVAHEYERLCSAVV